MKQSLTPEVRAQLLKFKLGTMVVSQSGEHIGHVVGYHMHSRNADEWDTMGRWIYQLKIQWASRIVQAGINFGDLVEDVSFVDFNDVTILEA